jgi:hypothetical protein
MPLASQTASSIMRHRHAGPVRLVGEVSGQLMKQGVAGEVLQRLLARHARAEITPRPRVSTLRRKCGLPLAVRRSAPCPPATGNRLTRQSPDQPT